MGMGKDTLYAMYNTLSDQHVTLKAELADANAQIKGAHEERNDWFLSYKSAHADFLGLLEDFNHLKTRIKELESLYESAEAELEARNVDIKDILAGEGQPLEKK